MLKNIDKKTLRQNKYTDISTSTWHMEGDEIQEVEELSSYSFSKHYYRILKSYKKFKELNDYDKVIYCHIHKTEKGIK